MRFTPIENLVIGHGIVLGGLYLLMLAGLLTLLLTLRAGDIAAGSAPRIFRTIFRLLMASVLLGLATAVVGTLAVYPIYRETARHELLASPALSGWHSWGMEAKERLGWISVFATASAALSFSRRQPAAHGEDVGTPLIVLVAIALAAGLLTGLLGALINKVAPVV